MDYGITKMYLVTIFVIILIVTIFYFNNRSRNVIVPHKKLEKCDNQITQIIDRFVQNYGQPIITPYIIGICGASGSGKSFTADVIFHTIFRMYPNAKQNDIVIISQDSYYKGGNCDTNYDIPESIDFELLQYHIHQLKSGKNINRPIYDFSTHCRKKETVLIKPAKIIIIEGILIFTQEKLRDLINIKIFIDVQSPIPIFRRIVRDTNERGRSIHEVATRYGNHVWPSYKAHVLPSSKYADISLNNFDNCYVGFEIVLSHLVNTLKNIFED